ncbi:porphobilinogen synthase [uncultured Tyzzerella sp.]|uniref:porphobilinogen synthase n=1 Tax=uncultured Tyzzerella sp. TaxID=2321398 RepID=UPI002942CA85|nr:porphobilinogen synthase [uncultured Tyzzerella sp.]
MNRGRRLRQNENIRNMVSETKVNKKSLIYPLFIQEGNGIKEEIKSMPNQFRYSIDKLNFEIENLLKKGINNIILFGIPDKKDCMGTGAYIEDGIIQKALKEIKKNFKEITCIADVCMCEYTNHGHCGILDENNIVDNDKTIKVLSKIATSYVESGADIIAPSDMMDGRIREIRSALDKKGFVNTPIISYAVKYSSAFYGPFREAADSAPSFGDRKTYQMDYRNRKEALKEALYDIEECADIIMVKPALSYLDIIRDIKNNINLPVCAYSVSGEYSMIKIAGANGIIDEDKIIIETTTSMYRAGTDILITYFAKEIAKFIDEGKM